MTSSTCLTCGRLLSEDSEECPVCALRTALIDAPDVPVDDWETAPATPRFGHYQILVGEDGKPFELGRGAMGVTYKALDVDLHCPVTLKVIHARYVKDESARIRFLREARAAAAVRNANVASVFHLGKMGEDYFYAMEFVPGETVEQILRKSGCFDPGTALEIVARTADGLGAIHKNHLIHRDIKPSNIMMNLEEGKIDSVKIIDLGLAKPVNESTAISLPGSFAGTPEYASPEQFCGVGVDIRSDLYSLGITLWQMLAGDLPFKGSCSEVLFQHQEAPLPVTKLSNIPQPVIALLEVLLEKNPSERFQTPAELVKGIEVVNQALGAGKRLTKGQLRLVAAELPAVELTAKRWRLFRPPVIPERTFVWLRTGGFFALLMLGAGLVLWIVMRLNEESRQLADVRREMGVIVTQFPQKEAEQRQARVKEEPGEARKRAIDELAKQFGLDPKLVEQQLPQFAEQLKRAPNATAYERAGAAYVAKDYQEAERLALAAADEAQHASPPKNAEAIKAFELAGLAAEEQIEYADALDRLREAEKLTDRANEPIEWARIQFAISTVLHLRGHDREAEPILREVLKERERAFGLEHRDTLWTRTSLARTLVGQGRYAEAEAEDRAVLTLQEKTLGPEHPDTLLTRNNLATALDEEGKYAEAGAEFRAVLKIQEKVLGPEHPDTLKTRRDLATALSNQGKYAEAETENRAALKVQEKVLGPEHPDTLKTRHDLATALDYQGKYAEAEAEFRIAVKLNEKVLGPEHPGTLDVRINLPVALLQQAKYVEAEAECRALLKLQEKVLGPEHPHTLITRNNLAAAVVGQGKHAEAESEDRALIKSEEKVLGPEHPYTLITRSNLADALFQEGKYAEAEAEERAVLQLQEKVLGPETPNVLRTRSELADALFRQEKYAEAEAQDQVVLKLREKLLGPEHPDTLAARRDLAFMLDQQGKSAEAEAEERAVLAVQEKVAGAEDSDTLQTRDNLATALEHQGKEEQAETEYRTVLKLREKVLGPQHPDTLETCFNLAQCLRTENGRTPGSASLPKNQEATNLARRAAEGARKVLGTEHPVTKKYEQVLQELEAGN